jgi:hypothetical protein
MDQATRNKLQKATQQIRRALESEFSEQLEGTFDILASGKILPEPGVHLNPAQRLIRQKLVDSITHNQASGKSVSEAIHEYTREAAFTFLNRFVALRMLEARGILLECVSKGDQSSGFKEFTGLAAGLASLPDGGYRLYLECLCDELSVEVKVLFDRRDPAGLLWPRRNALNEILETLGQTDLAAVWKEDETIGWVYQYFNSSEERKQMRDESAAPRNSRELAVRNQFFTPRYVVEFLTDNTLGRIWYEMRQGQTRLKETCKYLVRRPTEIFLDNPDAYQERDSRPWVKKVRSGDFSDLPDDPTESELASISLCFNGYDIVENLGTYGTFQESVETWLEEFEKTGKAPTLTLELWLMLFYKQRVWRHVYQSYPAGPEFIEQWRQLYLLWRESLLKTDELSQEELLKKPVFIPFRQIKDPREIRVLDPASGSGHFLLYSFDLLWEIYLEAWECGSVKSEDFGNRQLPFVEFDSVRFNPGAQVKSNLTHDFISPDDALVVAWDRKVGEPKPVRQWLVTNSAMLNRLPDKLTSYPLKEFNFSDAIKQGLLKKEDAAKLIHETGCWSFSGIPVRTPEEAFAEYKRQIPAMILAHNLHGIDIDLRATQIASLALWMRAQRAFQEMKLPVASRPAIRRSNIVCAEPMPGEAHMLDEFANQLNPPVLGQLVRVVFEKMKLAGEAGSLLKIEEEIRDAVETARQQFGSGPVKVQTTFFDVNTPAPRQQQFDLSGVRETEFFEQAEALVLDALRLYAEQAQTSQKTKRRLFAQDAARGFAFIDLCRKRYDVALMNPPFGDGSKPAKSTIEQKYPRTKNDLYAAFVEMGLNRSVSRGLLGAITSRTGFFLSSFQKWREEILLKEARPTVFADLGYGVLDAAMVETAAYCLEKSV